MPPNKQTKSESVLVPVTPDTKDEWREHCPPHDNEFDSLSDLVRTSVYREVNGHHETPAPSSGAVDAELIANMTTSLSALSHSVDEISERVRRIEDLSRTNQPEVARENIVMDVLPVRKDGHEGITVEQLARRYGFDKEDASSALMRLQERTNEINMEKQASEDGNPTTLFYKGGGEN